MTAPLTYQVSLAAHELHDQHGKCPVTVCLQQVQPLAHASQEINGSCTADLLHTTLSLRPCTGIEQLVTRRVQHAQCFALQATPLCPGFKALTLSG